MIDEVELLRGHPPFTDLGPEALVELRNAAERVSFVGGDLVLEEGGAPAESLYVVLEGSIELERDGEALDVLGPGESFGFPSLLSGTHPAFDVRANGSTACLRIDRATAERVLGSGQGLRFLAVELRERAELAERHDPGGLLRPIERARDVDGLVDATAGFPGAMADLRDEGYGALAVARATSRLIDAATSRAIDLAIGEQGSPPASWAWLAFGSVARREPGLAPDQDHTIVWEGGEDADPYFTKIAETVTGALARAGLPPCRSGVVATSPTWRGPIERWSTSLLAGRGTAARTAFLLALAIDLRRVAGPLSVEVTIRRLMDGVRRSELGLRVARLAVEIRPPLGSLGGMVTERRGGRRVIDLKQGGLLAVTDLARVAAIRCGLEATATLERLHGSVTGGSLEGEAARALEEAFETFNELRIDRQVQCVRTGEEVDAYVEPASLDPVSRSRLRQAFRVVDAAQARLHAELGGGRIR